MSDGLIVFAHHRSQRRWLERILMEGGGLARAAVPIPAEARAEGLRFLGKHPEAVRGRRCEVLSLDECQRHLAKETR